MVDVRRSPYIRVNGKHPREALMSKDNEHNNRPELFVDNQRYDWSNPTITGKELRTLAGIPENVDIYQIIPGQTDKLITDASVIQLTRDKGPERFSTHPKGSQAG